MLKLTRTVRVATTNLDRHGHRFTRRELEDLVAQAHDPELIYAEHDPSNPPVGRILARRLVTIEDGEFAIEGELELFDEKYFAEGKGMSVGVAASRTRGPGGDNCVPEVILVIEERTFGALESYDALTTSLLPDLTVHTRGLRRKGFEQTAILVIQFAVEHLADAFIGQGAVWAMRRLRAALLEREPTVNARVAYHLQFPMTLPRGEAEILIELPPGTIQHVQQANIRLEDAKRFIQRTVGDSELRTVVLRFSPDAPHWSIKYFVDGEGKVITL